MIPLALVVANAGRARFFEAQPSDAPRVKTVLVELESLDNPRLVDLGTSVTGRTRTETNTNRQAGPMHPMGAQRDRHRLELERRFSREIAKRSAAMTQGWTKGTLMLVAEPHMLGLLRETMRAGLQSGVALKELAKDYTDLSPAELRDRLSID